jgi:hypothetical protein
MGSFQKCKIEISLYYCIRMDIGYKNVEEISMGLSWNSIHKEVEA